MIISRAMEELTADYKSQPATEFRYKRKKKKKKAENKFKSLKFLAFDKKT